MDDRGDIKDGRMMLENVQKKRLVLGNEMTLGKRGYFWVRGDVEKMLRDDGA